MGDATTTTSVASQVISAFGTGIGQIVSDAGSMIVTIVPVGLGIAGVIWLVRKAMGWFKGMAK